MARVRASETSGMEANEFDSSDEEPSEKEETPFQVSWLALSPVYSQFLGICALPGCRFKNIRRNLQKDIEELKSYGVQEIFVLCTRGELSKCRVPNLLAAYQDHGFIVHHHPIPDGEAPDFAQCSVILNELRSSLEYNRKTLIHCYGGLGRSCLIAACLLLQLFDSVSPQQALDSLRDLRGPGAIQTIKQYNYLHDFREILATHMLTEGLIARSISR
ncbi:cyclin-dependent kinase inhibitor 3 isoform X1 [Anolis carolinensis]|uniref:cyclin-dependent kinase inhibitor 3 isoform X1 n=2 Tax=Anolis carolinensis TaxID=28377 RepID=UPI0007DB6D5D|nr:PREDICTED: cyclin-dependent kinase inhibitor 3 isoform X2 [Anolis carolinensis]|eukprot:XP_008119386.2 PREDICTED: cyclin-dependent kinase inhibitor 3 isoform X2 [Anolis carolinensis]